MVQTDPFGAPQDPLGFPGPYFENHYCRASSTVVRIAASEADGDFGAVSHGLVFVP